MATVGAREAGEEVERPFNDSWKREKGMSHKTDLSRRDFLKTTGIVLRAGALAGITPLAKGATEIILRRESTSWPAR